MQDKTYMRLLHHREVVSRHMLCNKPIGIEVFVPNIRAKIRPVVEQELGVAVGEGIWSWICRQVADTILAPDCCHVRTSLWIDLLRCVI